MNRIGLNRAVSNKSPLNESYLTTPANQQRTSDNTQPAGSASTIPEHPSQPASSNFNTPRDQSQSHVKGETQVNGSLPNYRLQSASPTEARRIFGATLNRPRPASQPRDLPSNQASSPLTAWATLLGSPKRTASVQPDKVNRNDTGSPIRPMKDGLTTGHGDLGKFSVR